MFLQVLVSNHTWSKDLFLVITCGISLITGVITSIELFVGVQSFMEVELLSSKDFYILSIDNLRILSFHPENRGVEGKSYLDEKYQVNCKLIEISDVLNKKMKYKLVPVDALIKDHIPTPSPSKSENSDV